MISLLGFRNAGRCRDCCSDGYSFAFTSSVAECDEADARGSHCFSCCLGVQRGARDEVADSDHESYSPYDGHS